MKKIIATVALLVVGILSATAYAAEVKQLRFMAGPPGGSWAALGPALCDIWTKEVLSSTSSTGGGVANIMNANTGKGDFGFSVTSIMGAALLGEEDFKDRPANNVVIMSNLYSKYTYFIARKDYADKHGIKSLGDIISKKLPVRFATLKTGTASEFVVNALFKIGYGIDYKKVIKDNGGSVEYASYEGGADLMADNHIDIFGFSVGKIASIVMNIESNTNVVILPVDDDALNKLSKAYGTVTLTIEPGIYKSVTKPVKTVGDYDCIVIRKDLPKDLVFKLNQAMWKNKKSLVSAVKDMEELTPQNALPAGLPVHEGSKEFWGSVK